MSTESLIKALRDHWFIVAVLFAGGGVWSVTQYRVSANETEQRQVQRSMDGKLAVQETRIAKVEDVLAAIAAVQAAQQATATAQQQSLDRIDRNLEEIARELRNQ